MINLTSPTGSVTLDPSVGNIPALSFRWEGRTISPLHRAAWADEPDALADDTVPLVDRKLAGDFVCAPFGLSDVEPSPLHGWTANSSWSLTDHRISAASFTLDRLVMGATITKTAALMDDAPLLVQTHTLAGGQGGLTFAHHPMMNVSSGARFSCSPKRVALTASVPIVADRNALALGARAERLHAVPTADGNTIDATQLPIADGTEDFIALVEADGSELGWSAVVRPAEGDVTIVLKDPDVLPLTMLWHSNGAREDFPWNGRNRGILGIEDGRAAGGAGHAAALADNPFRAEGVPTAFDLSEGVTHTIRHVLGAFARPEGWTSVRSIHLESDKLVVEGDAGSPVVLPFDRAHLFGGG